MIVTLYTKPDCALCDDVKRDLVDFAAQMDFNLRESNILEDDALYAKLRYLIPVVQIDPNGLDGANEGAGRVLLYPPHDWLTLHTALVNAQHASPKTDSAKIDSAKTDSAKSIEEPAHGK